MKNFFTCLLICICAGSFSKHVFAQKPLREISINGAVVIPDNLIFSDGLSFSVSVFIPITTKLKIGPKIRTDFLKWTPYFSCDVCHERVRIYSFDGRARYRLFTIDSFWSVLLDGEFGVTAIDPTKKYIDTSFTLDYPLNNKYGYNFGGGIFLYCQISRNVNFSLFVNYLIVKILTQDEGMGKEIIDYDYNVIYPGLEIAYVF